MASHDFERLEKTLASKIATTQSLEEIENWLKAQAFVKSVRLAGYLLKSNPPQREFIVEFKMNDGSTVTRIVNLYEQGNGRFQFNKLREQ